MRLKKIHLIIDGNPEKNKTAKKYSIVSSLVIVISVLLIILEKITPQNQSLATFFDFTEVIIIIFFTIEYILRIITSFQKFKEFSVISRPLRFIFSFYGLIDFFSIFPFFAPMFIGKNLTFLRAIRLVRFLRLLKLFRHSNQLKYWFDNAIMKSRNFLLFLLTSSILVGFLMALAHILYSGKRDDLFNEWWNSTSIILGVGNGANWYERIRSFVFWSFSIAVSGTIIGFITTKISSFVENLKEGSSVVLEHNHTIIIGWNNNVTPIIHELNEAFEDRKRKHPIIIFSNKPNLEMQDRLKINKKKYTNVKVITRNGNAANPDELKVTNIEEANSIIILNNEKNNDNQVITKILSICSLLKNKNIPIAVSFNERDSFEKLVGLKDYNIKGVISNEIISHMITQSCRHNGIVETLLEIMSFEGNEVYFKFNNELIGRTYLEALLSYDKSCLIGIKRQDGTVEIAPHPKLILQDTDQLILISENSSAIEFEKNHDFTSEILSTKKIKHIPESKKILCIGWSEIGKTVITSLSDYLGTESEITIATKEGFTISQPENKINGSTKITEKFISFKTEKELFEKIIEQHYDFIILLACNDYLKVEDADTTSIITLLNIENYHQLKNKKAPRIIVQLIDSKKITLTQITSAKELIVSDRLIALSLVQYALNPEVESVFGALFNVKHNNINVFPIEKYVKLNEPCLISELVTNAAIYEESFLGIMSKHNFKKELTVNPSKSIKIIPNKDDFIVVVNK